MNDPQTWTALGILTAAILGVITLSTQLMMRTITGQLTGLRSEMGVRFDDVDRRMDRLEGRMDRLEGRMDRIENRMDGIEKRVEGIDRDVQAISKRVFPE